MKKFSFSPNLSFDGVAIIIGCITCCVWFGSINETIKNHTDTLRRYGDVLQALTEGQKLQAANIAVLQTMINERTTPNNHQKP